MTTSQETTTLPACSLDEIDLEAARAYLRAHSPSFAASAPQQQQEGEAHDEAIVEALRSLRLVGTMGQRVVPTIAGVYLFGHTPQHVMPGLALVCAQFEGDAITSPILTLSHAQARCPRSLSRRARSSRASHARSSIASTLARASPSMPRPPCERRSPTP